MIFSHTVQMSKPASALMHSFGLSQALLIIPDQALVVLQRLLQPLHLLVMLGQVALGAHD